MDKKTSKKSGLELMRILSMLFIIVYHIIEHSGIIVQAVGGSRFLLILIEAFFVVHVNSFILLTGYFQSQKKARLSKVISIINSTWFYKLFSLAGIVILVKYFSFSNSIDMSFHQKITSILPLDRNVNWYINNYLLIYIFSPFLNILVEKLSKEKFKKLILVMFVIFSLIGTLLIGSVVPAYGYGRSILTFIFLYFVGAYLRKYPIEESRIFNTYTDKMKKYLFLAIYVVLALIIMAFRMTSIGIFDLGSAYGEIADVLNSLTISFLSPLVILEAVSYFLFFKNMTFNSKVINFIGGTTFGIYLLHENIYVRANLYNWLHMSKYANNGIVMVGMVLLLGLMIFAACMIIEIIRKAIFKFFYKRKFAEKIRNKVQIFIKSLGLDINY